MRKILAIVLGMTLAGLVVSRRILAQANSGANDTLIVGIVGDWMAENDARAWRDAGGKSGAAPKTLNFLDGVATGRCAAGTGGTLTLKFAGDDQPRTLACDVRDDGPCHVADFPVPGADAGKAFVCARLIRPPLGRSLDQRLWAAIVPLITKSRERFIAPVSRGLEPDLADAVVAERQGSVEISETLRDLDKGDYRFRISHLGSIANTGSEALTASVSWQGSGKATLSAAKLAPGLYRIVRLDAQGQQTGLDAWLLIVSEERFDETSQKFREARDAVAKWPDTVDARAPRAVLRACLQSLAGQP